MRTNFKYYLKKFTEHLQAKNLKNKTIKSHEGRINKFIIWVEETDVKTIQSVTKNTLDDYQKSLLALDLSYNQRRVRLSSLRMWFYWLCRRNTILFNPLGELEMPIRKEIIPRDVLTEKEAEKILKQPNITTATGLRDRAILEVLYSTGIRRAELINLKLNSIKDNGVLFIHQGKGSRDRYVPISERALDWVNKYIEDARLDLAQDFSLDFIFLSVAGLKLKSEYLGNLVSDYIKKAKVNKKGSCHMFRHTMATLMLENGADLRYIQEMLGHKQIQTTQVYTKVSLQKLQAVYQQASPFN